MKFFEYLAVGKPIVARRLTSLESVCSDPEICRLADTPDEFLAAIEAGLAETDDGRVVAKRLAVARGKRLGATGRGDRGRGRRAHRRGRSMKIAIVHDWLTGMRGGEKCLEVFCELWPDADVFTLLHVPGMVSERIERMRIHTSAIQSFPKAPNWYRFYLPFFPTAIEKLRPARLRPGHLQLALRGQGRPARSVGATHLLLLHADALRLGHEPPVLQ